MIKILRKLSAWGHQKKLDSYLEGLKNKGMKIGESSHINEPFFLDPDHCFLISIGECCTFAPNVRLIAHDASTKLYLGYTRIGKIVIGDNCFIGDSSIILPNVTIGSNTIIGSGSIVIKNIPENSVAAGNPAKVICSLETYLERIKLDAKDKGVFSGDYYISNLTQKKREKVLEALAGDGGYII